MSLRDTTDAQKFKLQGRMREPAKSCRGIVNACVCKIYFRLDNFQKNFNN